MDICFQWLELYRSIATIAFCILNGVEWNEEIEENIK